MPRLGGVFAGQGQRWERDSGDASGPGHFDPGVSGKPRTMMAYPHILTDLTRRPYGVHSLTHN